MKKAVVPPVIIMQGVIDYNGREDYLLSLHWQHNKIKSLAGTRVNFKGIFPLFVV